MVSILYEYKTVWPDDGPVQVQAPSLEGNVHVSPDSARRRANRYLSLEVAMEFQPGEPMLVWRDHLIWRMPVTLHLPALGELATVGTIEVDAVSREVIPLSENQIHTMRVRAHELVAHFTPSTEQTS